MQRTRPSLRHLFRARHDSGMAALEFALLAPVFFVLFAGMTDLGHGLYMRVRLEAAVAAGINYALVNANKVDSTSNGTNLAEAIATLVTTSNAGKMPAATVVLNNGQMVQVVKGVQTVSGTAANADRCYCPTGSPSNWTWGSAVSCATTCTGGGTSGKFVTVTASYSFTPLFSYAGFGPGGTITVDAAVQAQ
jgi:Flp pilus assembly protein TadG